ncbi:outer membrane beta-barrel protein [Kordia zhangzhouensis]|uniref:outer membrane beta-barrel protein n=1 Tax=Kordia zhangzhouensis TaxID=1620405 RepID=UPI0006296785|nr:outer membrane beta-barrel protein [Kordia zhangzhouensis]
MKKITLFALLFTFAYVNAQEKKEGSNDKLTFEKGSCLLSGGFFLDTTKIENSGAVTQENDQFGIGFNTLYGYAVKDNLFIGLGVGYSHNKNESSSPGTNTQELTANTFRIFPYVRYYRGIGERLSFFVQGETQFSKGKSEFNTNDDIKTKGWFIGVRPGLTYMFSDKLAIETTIGSLGYTTSNAKNSQNGAESDRDSFGLSLNSSNLVFGLTYYF